MVFWWVEVVLVLGFIAHLELLCCICDGCTFGCCFLLVLGCCLLTCVRCLVFVFVGWCVVLI